MLGRNSIEVMNHITPENVKSFLNKKIRTIRNIKGQSEPVEVEWNVIKIREKGEYGGYPFTLHHDEYGYWYVDINPINFK